MPSPGRPKVAHFTAFDHPGNRKATEPLEHAPNLRPAYRNRGISLTEMRAELVREAPFAGVCRDGREYGDGLL